MWGSLNAVQLLQQAFFLQLARLPTSFRVIVDVTREQMDESLCRVKPVKCINPR